MKMIVAIVVAASLVGFALFMLQQNSRDARNQSAIDRIISAGSGARVQSSAEQDAQYRQRIDNTRAGARYRQSQ